MLPTRKLGHKGPRSGCYKDIFSRQLALAIDVNRVGIEDSAVAVDDLHLG